MNDLNGSPLKIDTPGQIYTGRVHVKKMVWQEPAAAGESLTINDSSGRILWDENAYAGGIGISIEQDVDGIYDGIVVEKIDSGTLYIYYMEPIINSDVFIGAYHV